MSESRIAIINSDKCKPTKCKQECKKICPVVQMGKQCIEVAPTSKLAFIAEKLCNGCGQCVKRCPFKAITIINIPKSLEKDVIHRYSSNSFKLHRLPMPRPNSILGLVGMNGMGKSTALKILAGKIQPNFGDVHHANITKQEIITHFRGSELQAYFTELFHNPRFKAVFKPQYVDHLPKIAKGTVISTLSNKTDNMDKINDVSQKFGLVHLHDRAIDVLSGGELQRLAIATTLLANANMYIFDEPTSFLDIRQRLNAAIAIREFIDKQKDTTYAMVVEHDLAILDYLSDTICCLYGQPGAYGVITAPFNVREGINHYLAGYIPTENMRIRTEELSFHIADSAENEHTISDIAFHYNAMQKTHGDFTLSIDKGHIMSGEIIVLLGENGTGKTTFIRMLAGLLLPDTTPDILLNSRAVSLKPQKIIPKFTGTVRELLHSKIRDAVVNSQFVSDIIKPLGIHDLYDNGVQTLSGGELQRVAIALCLGTPADLYLIDEPSSYLDCEQRIIVSKAIRRFIINSKKTCFVVEHDFIMATYLANRVIVFEGVPGITTSACSPMNLTDGMNKFLQSLGITFRRDNYNFRPRINKFGSVKDVEQKASGNYFYNIAD